MDTKIEKSYIQISFLIYHPHLVFIYLFILGTLVCFGLCIRSSVESKTDGESTKGGPRLSISECYCYGGIRVRWTGEDGEVVSGDGPTCRLPTLTLTPWTNSSGSSCATAIKGAIHVKQLATLLWRILWCTSLVEECGVPCNMMVRLWDVLMHQSAVMYCSNI